MPEGVESIDWDSHTDSRTDCERCGAGYPRPCACGGEVHREVMTLPGGGYVQLTRCDTCHMPDGR